MKIGFGVAIGMQPQTHAALADSRILHAFYSIGLAAANEL
jgi:hypothetical protein